MNTRVVERSVVHYTNKERRKRNIRPVTGHKALIRAARSHSRWMARNRKAFSHTGQDNSRPWDRAKAAGYPTEQVSENILQTSGRRGRARKGKFRWSSDWRMGRSAVVSWMNSPGHRRNLLDPKMNHIGIGVARNRRGNVYVTQNFGNAPGMQKFGNTSSPLIRWLWQIIGWGFLLIVAYSVFNECAG